MSDALKGPDRLENNFKNGMKNKMPTPKQFFVWKNDSVNPNAPSGAHTAGP